MRIDLVLILIITLLSPWTWTILSANFLVGIACVLLSFLIIIFSTGNYLILSRKLYQGIFFVMLTFVSIYLMSVSFDRQLFQISPMQSIQVQERQRYYASELRSLYRNRYGIFYFDAFRPFTSKYFHNIALGVDINTLFLSGYDNNNSQARFPLLFFPFMVLGLFVLLGKFNKQFSVAAVLIFITSGFINTENTLGPILIYPIVSASIGLGFMKLLHLIS